MAAAGAPAAIAVVANNANGSVATQSILNFMSSPQEVETSPRKNLTRTTAPNKLDRLLFHRAIVGSADLN
jgi:hypothetical protein